MQRTTFASLLLIATVKTTWSLFVPRTRNNRFFTADLQSYLINKMSTATKERLTWNVRPATLEDAAAVSKLLEYSYQTLLPANYEAEFLEKALPLITRGK